jgi:hypothetical protein
MDKLQQQLQQQQKCPMVMAPAANSSSVMTSCSALQQQVPACGSWSPKDAAYAVAALLHSHPDQAAWASSQMSHAHHINSSSGNNGSSSDDSCPASPEPAAMPAFLQAATRSSCKATPPLIEQQQGTNESAADSVAAAAAAGDQVRAAQQILSFDSGTQQLTIRASALQLLLAAAALAVLAFLAGKATGRPSGSTAPTKEADLVRTAGKGVNPQQQQQQQQQQQRKIDGANDEGCELPDASRYDQHTAAGRKLSASAAGHSSDPFGYGNTAAAPAAAAAVTMPGSSAAAAGAVVSAVRRASVMAVGHAASSLKDAFAGRAAAAARAGPGTAHRAAAAAAAAAQGPSPGAAEAAMWDEADEDVVNELPASIQAHLQAGGRWARDKGGRLVRGSLNALRAASTMAAGALCGAAAAAGWTGGEGEQQGQIAAAAAGGLNGGAGPDAVLLQRLMVAGPGTELVLSDEEA